jgi:molecular chaperone HscB
MPDDPFALLELAPSFEIDPKALQAKLLTLSGQYHPDRFADPIEQADATAKLAKINDAHRILSNPAKRAEALLAILGPATETAAKPDALPPELLMEVMEIREALEDAVASEDSAEIARLREWAEQQKAERLERIAQLFSEAALDAPRAGEVQLELNALRYAQRMLDQMPPARD